MSGWRAPRWGPRPGCSGTGTGPTRPSSDPISRAGPPPSRLSRRPPPATGFAALLGIGGFAAQWGALRPGRWAAAATAAPLLILASVYWRLGDFAVSVPWTAVGLALAVAYLAASWQVARFRERPGL